MTHEDAEQVKADRPDYARPATTIIGLLVIIYLPAPAIEPALGMALVVTVALGASVLGWTLKRRGRPVSIEPFLVPVAGMLSIVLCAIEYPPSTYGYDRRWLALAAATASAALVLWIRGRKKAHRDK